MMRPWTTRIDEPLSTYDSGMVTVVLLPVISKVPELLKS